MKKVRKNWIFQIFLEEELFGETYEDYKSVYYTLYKLANQAQDKFDKKTIWQIEHEDSQDKIKKETEERENMANGNNNASRRSMPSSSAYASVYLC